MDFSKIAARLESVAQHFDASMLDYLGVIAEHTATFRFRAGERFPIRGREDHQAAYITEGVFRVFSVDAAGRETIVRLAAEGDFTMYIEDYKSLNPDLNYHWEAVTDAIVFSWGKEDLEFLVRNVPNWYLLTLKILQTVTLRVIIERGEMFSDDATTRYTKFSERYPHIISRVPLWQIANYLGIAPQSLSRIRQSLAKQKTN